MSLLDIGHRNHKNEEEADETLENEEVVTFDKNGRICNDKGNFKKLILHDPEGEF